MEKIIISCFASSFSQLILIYLELSEQPAAFSHFIFSIVLAQPLLDAASKHHPSFLRPHLAGAWTRLAEVLGAVACRFIDRIKSILYIYLRYIAWAYQVIFHLMHNDANKMLTLEILLVCWTSRSGLQKLDIDLSILDIIYIRIEP